MSKQVLETKNCGQGSDLFQEIAAGEMEQLSGGRSGVIRPWRYTSSRYRKIKVKFKRNKVKIKVKF